MNVCSPVQFSPSFARTVTVYVLPFLNCLASVPSAFFTISVYSLLEFLIAERSEPSTPVNVR